MVSTIVRLNLRIQLVNATKQWWRIVLMVFLGLYLLGISTGIFITAYALGLNSSIEAILKPQIALLYSLIIVLLFIIARSASSTGSGMVNAEMLKPYLPYTPKLAEALWVAALISIDNFILGYLLLPPVIMWIGAGDYLAATVQAIMNLVSCIFVGSTVKYLAYSAELETDQKKKITRQIIYGIFVLVITAGGTILVSSIPSFFESDMTQKYQYILQLVHNPAYQYSISLVGAIPGLGIVIVPIAFISENWVALAVAIICGSIYATLYHKQWQILVHRHMQGENKQSKNESKTIKQSGNIRSRKLVKTFWPGEKIAKIFLKNPPSRVHFSRLLIYQYRDPRSMMVIATPIYMMVIFSALAYFQDSFYGAQTPYSKVQAVLFTCSIICVSLYQCRWYLDSTAYWYQIVAALAGKEDIKTRLLLTSLTIVPIFLIMSSILQIIFGINGIEIIYTYVNTILAIAVSLAIGFLFSSFFANPGPAPGQGITNKINNGSGKSILLQTAIIFLALGIGAIILLVIFLGTAAISYFTGKYMVLVLSLRLIFSAMLIWATVVICGKLIDKNQVKLLQIVASWPKHTYHV